MKGQTIKVLSIGWKGERHKERRIHWKNGFLQRDSVEHEGYAEARSAEQMEAEEQDNARKTRTIRIYNIREKYESLHI